MEFLVLMLLSGAALGVEVHFENKDSGFFLKHTARWSGGAPEPPAPAAAAPPPPGALLSLDRFTVLQAAQPASVRATYGPFSTKQTVPARYSVPDPLEPPAPRRNASLLDLQDVASHRLDVSAHVVFRELARDSPALRVLFHAGSEAGARRAAATSSSSPAARAHRVCISLRAQLGARSLSASCGPEGEEGACLAELSVPASWWPADGRGKRPPRAVRLSYSAAEAGEAEGCGRVSVQPAWPLGTVTLVAARAGYREVRAGDAALLVPRAPLYPRAHLHLPLVLRRDTLHRAAHLVLKMRVKSGLRLLGVTATNTRWSVTAEVKARVATLTASRLEPPPDGREYTSGNDSVLDESTSGWEEVAVWLVEVGGEGEAAAEGGRGAARLVWSARVTPAAAAGEGAATSPAPPAHDHPRVTARLDVEKDDIQAVLPISKNWEVLNTAVLTGRQVSQAMKVLIVSQAGQVADVTLQSSCRSEDESVLKVSSSCSSVYVDGSEIRGSSNASVIVKYGTYTGLARFTVWMPENRLEVDVDDTRLSQIKGWRVSEDGGGGKLRLRRSYAARGWSGRREPAADHTNSLSEARACRLRYQQSPVEVYARFLATDHDSGRVSYFVSRRTWLKVTDLVISLMRVSDPRIASLQGRILQGRSMGRTEVQVLSPITGRVIGLREVRVVNDKVTVSRLLVRVISGLQLNIAPDPDIDNGYVSETTVTRRLTAQYQEGLLDIDIEFTDNCKTPLRDVAVSDYYLRVESLNTEVVAFAPMAASHHPRVIAVGEGSGELLRVTLLTAEECRAGSPRRTPLPAKGDAKTPANVRSEAGALAAAAAGVDVDFRAAVERDAPQRPDTPQNDDVVRTGRRSPFADMSDILLGYPPFKDENNREPTVQARQHGSARAQHAGRRPHPSAALAPNMTPLEIGMYALLGAFCFAIVIFVVSCVVYASKTKGGPEPLGLMGPPVAMQSVNAENGKIQVAGLVGTTLGFGRDKTPRESTTNAHDWVWLGRATIDRSGHHPSRNSTQSAIDNGNNEMRITSNPLNHNYVDPEDAIRADVMVTSFDNPNSIELPSQAEPNGNRSGPIDSTTYCKKPRHGRQSSGDTNRQWPTEDKEQEYRPPVPPHRNTQLFVPVPPRNPYKVLADTIMPPPARRGHHARAHKRHEHAAHPAPAPAAAAAAASPHGRRAGERVIDLNKAEAYFANYDADPSKDGEVAKMREPKLTENPVEALTSKEDCSALFEFDSDAPAPLEGSEFREAARLSRGTDDSKRTFAKPQSPDYMRDSGIGLPEVQMRHKNRSKENHRGFTAPDDFVNATNQNNGGNSPEVKRATIVGNPMCAGEGRAAPDDAPAQSLGLDDLEMDYDQIMHYFHNLKESNA